MILVLDYNKNNSSYLDEILKELGEEYNYSSSESKIIKAERIILPQTDDFSAAFRKMSMMNLFSILRIVNKPILGINDSVRLMCNQVGDQLKCGLGLFKLDREQLFEHNNSNFERGRLQIPDDSKLVPNELNDTEIIFDPSIHSSLSEYSKTFIIQDNTRFTLTFENNNYFGVELSIEQNRNLAKEILSNFCKI